MRFAVILVSLNVWILLGSELAFAQDSLTTQVENLARQLAQDSLRQEGEPSAKWLEIKKRAERLTNVLTNIKRLEESIQAAPTKLGDLKSKIEAFKTAPPQIQQPIGSSKETLEALQKKWATTAEKAQSLVDSLLKGSGERLGERKRIQSKLSQANNDLTKVTDQINDLAQKTEATQSLRKLDLDSQKLESQVNIRYLTNQQKYLDVDDQLGLTQKQIELAKLEVENARRNSEQITTKLNEIRKTDAEKQVQEVKKQAQSIAELYPELASSEKTNVELADRIKKAEAELAITKSQRDQNKVELSRLRESFKNTVGTLEGIGRSTSVGAMLRKRKSEIPNVLECLQNAAEAQEKIEEVQFWSFEVDEQLKDLGPEVIQQEIRINGDELSDDRWKQLQEPVEQLIERRQKLLLAYRKILNAQFEGQLDSEVTNTSLAQLAHEFEDFINERIFWIRSNRILFSEWTIDESDKALFATRTWREVFQKFQNTVGQYPLRISLGVALIFFAIFFRARFRNAVDLYGQTARRGSCTVFLPTIQALILTALIAVSVPLILVGTGWALKSSVPSGNLIFDAVAIAVYKAGLFALALEILRRICRPGGLAVCHFDWPDSAVAKLKRNLKWYVPLVTVCVFCCSLFLQLDVAQRSGSDLIERSIFLGGMSLTIVLFFQLFQPENGIFSGYLQTHRDSWITQTSTAWFIGLLLVPISLAILAVFGYYFTAVKLTEYLYVTFAFGLIVELVRSLIRRFVLLRRRRAHIETARRKREAELEAERERQRKRAEDQQSRIEAGEETAEPIATPTVSDLQVGIPITESIAELQEQDIEIDVNAGQANQLIRLAAITAWIFGLWIIWSDVLPAIKALDQYKIWGPNGIALATEKLSPTPANETSGTNSEVEAESQETKNPDSVTDTEKMLTGDVVSDLPKPAARSASVSIRDFLIFLAIGIATFFAARNLPNAFEMLFLKELPVDRSARLASKSLFSYAIVFIGLLSAMRALKIDWSSIQWLVTALTFGLAFGLQEIFANFVAGIILMFERPMRIGDVVTVDEYTGVVTRIRTRATTIVNWDRKEYIIPNRDFITGRLINWTLSDEVNRLQFSVGIAYGSDVALAKQIVLEICAEHSEILTEPSTSITFEEFADSYLKLVVRTFLGAMGERLRVIDQLHSKINSRFAEAGIEIAFPQQDIHVRSIDTPNAMNLGNSRD